MALRLNGLAQYNEPVGRDYVDYLRFGAAPSFAWGIGTPTLVTASYYYYYENNQPDRGIPIVTFPGQIGGPPDVDPSNYYGHRAAGRREGAPAPRHRHLRPQVQRQHRAPQHHPLPVVGPAGRGHAGRHPPADHRRAAAGLDRRHPQPRGPRRERVDHRQPDRGPVQVQHLDAQAQARGRRRLRPPDLRPPDDHAHAGAEHLAHQSGHLPAGHLHLDERRAVRGGRLSVGRLRRRRRPDPVVAQVHRGRALRLLRLRLHELQCQRHRRLQVQPRGPVLVAARRAHRAAHGSQTYYFAWGRSFNPSAESSTRSTSPTRARIPRRPTRTSSAASSASSTTRSA